MSKKIVKPTVTIDNVKKLIGEKFRQLRAAQAAQQTIPDLMAAVNALGELLHGGGMTKEQIESHLENCLNAPPEDGNDSQK